MPAELRPEKIAELRAAARAGKNLRAIAKEHGVCYATAIKYVGGAWAEVESLREQVERLRAENEELRAAIEAAGVG